MRNRLQSLARAAALLAAVMLIALLLAVAIVHLPMVQRWAGAQVSAHLPAGVQIERATITLFPPGVQLTKVAVGTDTPMLASVSCRLRLPALLGGRLELSTVVVDGATLVVLRDADGQLQFSGPLAVLLAAEAASAASAPSPAAATMLAQLPAVTVNHASITFVDHVGHGGPRTLQLTAVRLTVDNAAAGSMPFTLAAQLDPSGQISGQGIVRQIVAADGGGADHTIDVTLTASRLDADTVLSYLAASLPGGGTAEAQGSLDASLTLSGSRASGLSGDATLSQSVGAIVWDEVHLAAPLEMSAHLVVSPDTLVLSDGHLHIAQVAAARVVASDFAAEFAYADSALHLTSAQARAYGGSLTQHGTVTVRDPPMYDVTVRADDVDCEALLTAVTGERPNYGCERLSAEAAVHGQWTGAESVAHGAQGSGRIEMRGGTIPSSSIIGAVWHAAVPVLAAGREPRNIGAPTRVDRLTESFTLRDGVMHTSDLSLLTDDYTVTGTGRIGLEGTLDLNTEVALTAAGVAKLLVMAALPIPSSVPALPPIPTIITGTVGSPTIRPDVEDLPFAAVRSLFTGARGAGEVLKEGAGRGLRGIKRGLEEFW